MPEALTANTRKQVSAIVGESSCPENNDNSNYVEDEIWGFRITGGSDFGIPITVFHVTQGSRANQAGIKLGDTIVKINDTDTKDMSLAEANQRIQDSGNDIKLSVRSFEEDESNENEQQHEITMEKKKEIDRENWIPQPERKVWHPVMWQQAPPPIRPELVGKDAPHRRIISNIYRFFRETENNPDARKKHIEDMLLALPSASKQF